MSHRYRFEIFANGFKLVDHYNLHEENGLDWTKQYMSRFQNKVANVGMKVRIFEREKQKRAGDYSGKPYTYKKTIAKKPLISRTN